jgi:hypothetical protein
MVLRAAALAHKSDLIERQRFQHLSCDDERHDLARPNRRSNTIDSTT